MRFPSCGQGKCETLNHHEYLRLIGRLVWVFQFEFDGRLEVLNAGSLGGSLRVSQLESIGRLIKGFSTRVHWETHSRFSTRVQSSCHFFQKCAFKMLLNTPLGVSSVCLGLDPAEPSINVGRFCLSRPSYSNPRIMDYACS